LAHGTNACAVAGDSRQPAALGPTTIPIHDNGDVLGQAVGIDLIQEILIDRFCLHLNSGLLQSQVNTNPSTPAYFPQAMREGDSTRTPACATFQLTRCIERGIVTAA
jgi:hypothetical protein